MMLIQGVHKTAKRFDRAEERQKPLISVRFGVEWKRKRLLGAKRR